MQRDSSSTRPSATLRAPVAQELWRRLTTLRSLRQQQGTLEVEATRPDSSMAAAPFISFGGCGRVPTRTTARTRVVSTVRHRRSFSRLELR